MPARLLESGARRRLELGPPTLTDVRERIIGVLAPPDDEWCAVGAVDAFTPPGYLVQWADTWVRPATHCHVYAAIDVVCIAGRIEPDPGLATLEQLLGHALRALALDGFPPRATTRPARFDIGGVHYLAAHLTLDVPLTLGGP